MNLISMGKFYYLGRQRIKLKIIDRDTFLNIFKFIYFYYVKLELDYFEHIPYKNSFSKNNFYFFFLK